MYQPVPVLHCTDWDRVVTIGLIVVVDKVDDALVEVVAVVGLEVGLVVGDGEGDGDGELFFFTIG